MIACRGASHASRRWTSPGWTRRVVLAALVSTWPMAAGCGGAPAAAPAAAPMRAGAYFPLVVGHRWELRAADFSDRMVFEVTSRDGDDFIVRWINPFVPGLRFRFAARGDRIDLTGLDVGRGLGPIPAGVTYFDFSKRQDEGWTNATGRFRVTAVGQRVTTPAGTYDQAIDIETTDTDGQSMHWTFAPNVGIVRWGRGRDAYLLTSFREGRATEPQAAAPQAAPPPAAQATDAQAPAPPERLRLLTDHRLRVSLDANPAGAESALDAYARAVDAGLGFVHLAPTWTEIEPSDGRFRWPVIDLRSSVAETHGLPIHLNLRVIDSGRRGTPTDASWSFGDPRLADRLIAALRAIAQRTRGRVRWIAIGNEVDLYFASHPTELPGYVQLLTRVLPVVREVFPQAWFTVNVTFGGLSQLDRYRDLTDLIDCYSFTYYPLNADFTMRAPRDILDDLPRMVAAAGQKPVILQEIGYASAARLNSSEQQQADFVTHAFAALRQHHDRVMGAAFLFMSDLPLSTVEDLAMHYAPDHRDNFKAYLATLGLRTTAGAPKPAWDAFVREARRVNAEATR